VANTKFQKLAALTWMVSALLVISYAVFGAMGFQIPGVRELADFLVGLSDIWASSAAMIAIFIEGLYLIGQLFPGSTVIVVLAISANFRGLTSFGLTIFLIFVGWLLSGFANIAVGKLLRKRAVTNFSEGENVFQAPPSSSKWITWFPAFRANYEVSNVVEGYAWKEVMISSSKIKLITSLIMGATLLALAETIDIHSMDNKDGFISLLVVGIISFGMGFFKLKNLRKAVHD